MPFRFSLRAALLIVAVACVLLVWRTRLAQQQRSTIESLRQLGAQIHLRDADWHVRLLGQSAVTSIDFLGPQVSDANVEDIVRHASKLKSLAHVRLVETAVTPNGKSALRSRLPHVEIELVTPVLAPASAIR